MLSNDQLHHADEGLSRDLVKFAMSGSSEDEDANILTDSGWFLEDATALPTMDDLKALQSQLSDAALGAPENWVPVADPTVVEQHQIFAGGEEYETVVDAFMSTLKGAGHFSVQVHKVYRIQNLAMWQSFIVKRQTICYRETGAHKDNSDEVQKKALQRFERCWLWHGTNIEVMDKILQQGFNRSFCGKNATR